MKKFKKSLMACLVAIFAVSIGLGFGTMPKEHTAEAAVSTKYTIVDAPMMGYVQECYSAGGNLNFFITLPGLDNEVDGDGIAFDGVNLTSVFNEFGFFDNVMINGKTLRELGCTSFWDNTLGYNIGEPKPRLYLHTHFDPATLAAAMADGTVNLDHMNMGVISFKEGTLIPGYRYLKGLDNAVVYRAGCDFDTTVVSGVAYERSIIGKTEVQSIKYVQNNPDGSGYLGVSLFGDDYLGAGELDDTVGNNLNGSITNWYYDNTVLLNGETGRVGNYSLVNLGVGVGYYAFYVTVSEANLTSITIPAGTKFPMYYYRGAKGSQVGNAAKVISYFEIQTTKTFTKDQYGNWYCEDDVEEIETEVTMAMPYYSDGVGNDYFLNFELSVNDYAGLNTYSGSVVTAREYLSTSNIRSHVLINGEAFPNIAGETFLNVWGEQNVFSTRGFVGGLGGYSNATEINTITVLAGCKFPSYELLANGTRKYYVTTEDVTFVKVAELEWVKYEGVKNYTVNFIVEGSTYHTQEVVSGETVSAPTAPTKADSGAYAYSFTEWQKDGVQYDFSTPVTGNITLTAVFTKYLKPGEHDTSIKSVVFGRTNEDNWMLISLTEKDYPSPSVVFNKKDVNDVVSASNLYDKIVVDGYTLRAREGDKQPTINHWQADCLGLMIPGAEAALDGAQKVVIRAGAQFPSYEYFNGGEESYFVTTEEITFVNVGANNGVWERQYTATFVADGEVVGRVNYVASQGLTAPEVPYKEGYRGQWETYTANGNITVNAVYNKLSFDYEDTDVTTFQWDGDGNSYVTFYLTNGENVARMYGDNTSYKLNIYNLWDNIIVTTRNGNQLTLGEAYVGDGGDSWYISFGGRPSFLLKLAAAYRKDGSDPIVGIYVPAGTEFPSFDEYGTKAYVTTVGTTYEYNGENVWTYLFTESSVKIPEGFENNYILSDLYKIGYEKSSVLKDGVETLTNAVAEEDYRYGYVDGTSFTISFDMSFVNATYYETFNVGLGTEGYEGNKSHFGWRFYLLRGSDSAVAQNICIEYYSNTSSYGGNIPGSADKVLGSAAFVAGEVYHITIGYKLVNASTGEILVYTSVNQYTRIDTYVLGGSFVNFAPFANSVTMNAFISNGSVTVSNPFMDRDSVTAEKHNLVLNVGNEIIDVETDKYVLPEVDAVKADMAGKVFVGWTTDIAGLSNLYPAGYEIGLSEDTTLYPVWVGFAMEKGASVRINGGSGLRFVVLVDGDSYDALGNKVLEAGTVLCPSSYLDGRELTHELGAGYFLESKLDSEKWINQGAKNRKYAMAYVGISPDQYAREFSARGYLKIQYTTGTGYIYTAYDAENHSRSIYEVATAAINAGEIDSSEYVNSVADIVVDSGLNATKNENARGNYQVSATKDGSNIVITITGDVKAFVVNGVRIVMGYTSQIEIGGVVYTLSESRFSSIENKFTFAVEMNAQSDELMKRNYLQVLNSYLESTAYTEEHKAVIDGIANECIEQIENSNDMAVCKARYEEAIAEISRIKTAEELSNNRTSDVTLATPTLNKGLGYTVTWNAVAYADYYTITDSNGYQSRIVVMKEDELVYKAEVVGDHNVTVTAHSYYEEYNSSAASNVVATPEVKPVFSYKAMSDGLYKFSSSQMSTMGISTSGCYYDSSDSKYFAYYNKDLGWTPYPALATDWTSPEEFPDHAQRLKDMGNNIILINRDTTASYTETDTWEASRLRYIMDTAWSMGMKVIVCDEIFYKYSMSDGSSGAATSVNQVATAIAKREGFADYVTHPAFFGFSLDDEPYGKYISAMSYTIEALDKACEDLGVSDPFYLACLFQAQGGELGKELYLTQSSLESYYNKWLAIKGVDSKYLYVDIYTQHAMDQPTNRYNTSFEVVYDSDYLGGKYEFHQAITAHTQNDGVLLEQDMYMSLLYAAAHNVAGYSWFCYFPIAGELAGCMVGYDGNGYGNGIGNNNEKNKCYYNAAKIAGYQYELIQGLLDGYVWETRSHDDSKNLLTTTLSNGTKTATFYVNADVDNMSGSVTVTASGSECYLVGYGVGTELAPYQAVSGSVTLAPGQAVICIS